MENQQAIVVIPQVTKKEAESFSKVWRLGGLVIPLDDASLQFATDFVNITLISLYRQLIENTQAMQQPKIVEVTQ